MLTKKDNYTDLYVFLTFSVMLFFSKYSCLRLPAFSDEWNYIHSSLAVYNNHLNPFVKYWAYHPPVFVCFTGLLFKLFGYSLAIARLSILFFSLLTLYFTFLTGKKLFGLTTGILASGLLFFSPFFFAQSGLFYADMLATALTMATIYYFISNNRLWYFISGTLLVLTKEPAIIVIIGIAVYKAILSTRKFIGKRPEDNISWTKEFSEILIILSPLVFFLTWMLLNKVLLGWYFFPVFTNVFKVFSLSLHLLMQILQSSFLEDYRFLFAFAILAVIAVTLIRRQTPKDFIRKEYLLFAILALFITIFYAGLSKEGIGYGYQMRYVFFLQPLYFIAGTAAILRLITNRAAQLAVCSLIVIAFVSCWHKGPRGHPDTNLSYIDIVQTQQKAYEFLADNYSSNQIIGALPITIKLAEPMLGYVNRPLLDVMDNLQYMNEAKKPIIVVSKFYRDWTPQGPEIEDFTLRAKLNLLKVFISNSGQEEIRIYSLP